MLGLIIIVGMLVVALMAAGFTALMGLIEKVLKNQERMHFLEMEIMTELGDKIAAVSAKIDEVASAQADASASQTAEIARVEALILAFPPPVTAEDLAALDALNAKLDGLKATEAAQKAEADAERP